MGSKNNNQNKLVVFIGVAASGKTVMVERVRDKHGFFYIPAVTTRPQRKRSNGNYRHVSTETFESYIKNGEILEYTHFAGNYYGKLQSDFKEGLQNGHCTLTMTADRVKNLKEVFPHATFVCIHPDDPILKTVEKRLRNRGVHTEAEIQTKIQSAIEELEIINSLIEENLIDHHIVTKENDFNHALREIDRIIAKHKTLATPF